MYAAAPPMRVVTIGAGAGAVSIGGETVLFRHEEKFHRPTAVAIRVSDQGDVAAEVDAIAKDAQRHDGEGEHRGSGFQVAPEGLFLIR